MRLRHSRRLLRTVVFALAAVLLLPLRAPVAAAQGIPDRIADSTFWRMITTMSEPDGYFRSENLVGNESSYMWVIPELQG